MHRRHHSLRPRYGCRESDLETASQGGQRLLHTKLQNIMKEWMLDSFVSISCEAYRPFHYMESAHAPRMWLIWHASSIHMKHGYEIREDMKAHFQEFYAFVVEG